MAEVQDMPRAIATSLSAPIGAVDNAPTTTEIPSNVKAISEHGGPPPPSTSTPRELRSTHGSTVQSTAPAMSSISPSESQHVEEQSVLDPISRQIIERTQIQHKIPQTLHNVPGSHAASGPSGDQAGRKASEPLPVRRVDSNASTGNKLTKDKKKGVSFLSRIMGSKKREDSSDVRDSVSEISDNRPAGIDAELFSQPVGYIPRFPFPPKYIKVKAQNRKEKDFDRVFLAQVLLGATLPGSRKQSIDSKIHSIDDAPNISQNASTKSPPKAIWAMEFSKDGRYLAAAGQDKKLRVWEVVSNAGERETEEKISDSVNDTERVKLNAPVFKQKLVREYDGHTSSILDLSWSKNNFLLSSSMDKTVRLYHVSRTECLCAFKHNDFVTSIQFHPRDDRFFLAGSLDSKLRLWSIPDKSVAFFTSVPDMVTAVAFTPDGKSAIAGCLNGLCLLYDTEGLKAHSQIHVRSTRGRNTKGSKITGIDTIAIPRENGQTDVKLLITSNDSRVRMYNLKDKNLEVKFRGNENSCSQIHASFSDDGQYVICGSEDRKVYIWPTGPTERPESDKRPMEVFEAHSTIVTSALLAPTNTRRLLAQSGDPLYDLCNPPPVTLLSRADSVISSRAPTHHSGMSEDKRAALEASRQSESPPRKAPESPAFLARHSHPGGQIIVTADYAGQIKVFRQDCAFQKRRHESWDATSTFSKKVLGRSGSVMTGTSVTSSQHRNSLNLGSKNPSNDRILNWRNSVADDGNSMSASNSISDVNLRASIANDRARSASPKKSLSHRFSLRHANFPRPNQPSPPLSPDRPHKRTSEPHIHDQPSINIEVAPPATPDSPATYHSASANSPSQDPDQDPLQTKPPPVAKISSNPTAEDLPHSPSDPLFLAAGQSWMAWDVKHTLLPMANHPARTPGLLGPDGDPLSRRQSYVSQLSSEIMSSASDADAEDAPAAEGRESKANSRLHDTRRESARSEEREGEELKCKNCGSSTFRAIKMNGGQRLRCRQCGTIM